MQDRYEKEWINPTTYRYNYMTETARGGICIKCHKQIPDYHTCAKHDDGRVIHLFCLEHAKHTKYGDDMYWGYRNISDPEGFLTYTDG